MKSYWYVSLTHEYPQPNRSTDSVRVKVRTIKV